MRPRPLNQKADLIKALEPYAPTKACARAIAEGRVTVLGGFKLPDAPPRVLVEITSRFGNRWIVGLVVDEEAYQYKVIYPKDIPWQHWAGVPARRHPVLDGDSPDEWALKRKEAKDARTTETQAQEEDKEARQNQRPHHG